MATESKDLIVLGSGPGGYVAAIRAAQLGRKITIVEKESLGGVCLNWGCIPSKALLKSAVLCREMRHSADYGITCGEVKVDFEKVMERSRQVAGKLSQGVSFLMKKNKIEVIMGHGVLEKGNRLAVTTSPASSSLFEFRDIIIATGARPKMIPGLTADGETIHTSRTLLANKKQPKKLLVIGAGAIGVEFAYFFNAMGTEVTLVEMLEQVLPVEDTEIAEALRRSLMKQGLIIRTGCAVSNVHKKDGGISAVLKTKDSEETWQGDCCLVATGVQGNTDNIGLEKIGLKTDRGFIEVDDFMRTNLLHHYAIGDVAGAPWLAHVASHEGLLAAEHASGQGKHKMRYDNIPGCTYCQPQVASVGLTEKQAREKGLNIAVSKVQFGAIGKAIAIGEPEGLTKVISDKETGEIYGVHILHAEATELISEAAVIRSHEGIPISVLDTIHPHPTLSEAIAETMAVALGRPVNT